MYNNGYCKSKTIAWLYYKVLMVMNERCMSIGKFDNNLILADYNSP